MNPTEEQLKARRTATGYTQSQLDIASQTGNAITSADLAPVQSLNLPSAPQSPDFQGITGAIPQIDLSQFQAPSEEEGTQSDISRLEEHTSERQSQSNL